MYIEKLNIEVFTDYKIKGKKPQSDKIANLFFNENMGVDSDNLETLIEAVKDLYNFDPVRVVVNFETNNN